MLDAFMAFVSNIFVLECFGRTETGNPGNTLYVTGLSTRVTERDLEKHFSKEGKVVQGPFL